MSLPSLILPICQANDHKTALEVLWTIRTVKNAGYITPAEMAECLVLCANIFAQHHNLEFFAVYARALQDITEDLPYNPFSTLARCYYFITVNGETLLNNVLRHCSHLDKTSICEDFFGMVVRNHVYRESHLATFINQLSSSTSEREFRDLCLNHIINPIMTTGFRGDALVS